MTPFILRDEPRPDDREAVRRIVTSTGFFHDHEIAVAVELIDDRLARGPASDYRFIFADDPRGHTLGYACFGPIACTVGSFDLYWVAVDAGAQRAGLGRALMREAERRIAREAGRLVYVETSSKPQYAPTRAFYERCGYRVQAHLPDFYAPGDDKLILVKPAVEHASTAP